MSMWKVPAVVLPAAFGACVVLTLVLSLRILKILRSVYLHNAFHLEPSAIYKCESAPATLRVCVKTFLPLVGACSYRSPQFDLPSSAHLLLAFIHFSLLWCANVACVQQSGEFEVQFAIVCAAIATAVAMGLTYVLISRYIDSYNTQSQPELISQSGTELNRRSPRRHPEGSTFIDTSGLQIRSNKTCVVDTSKPSSMTIELILLSAVMIAVVADFWSLGCVGDLEGEAGKGALLQWAMGVGVDLALRVGVCAMLKVTGAVPNFANKYYVVEYGLSPVQLHKFSKTPSVGLVDMSAQPAPLSKSPKESFYQDPPSVCLTPPKPSRRPSPKKSPCDFHLPAINSHHQPVEGSFAKDFDDFLESMERVEPTRSPEKKGKVYSRRESPERRMDEPAGESMESSSRVSQDTMPEVPHNMLSPVETPRGYSGMRFYRTPERPYFGSPERSPEKPRLQMKSPPRFELRLAEVQVSHSSSNSESEPESQFITYSSEARCGAVPSPRESSTHPVEDEEVYMVEFLPGGIMPNVELSGSQYESAARPAQSGYRSQSLPKPQTAAENGTRSKSGERKPPTPRMPGDMLKREMRKYKESWVRSPTSADKERLEMPLPGLPSLPLYPDDEHPLTEDSLREISNTERIHRLTAQRKSRKEVEQTIDELLQAAKSNPQNKDYERLADMLAVRNSFRRKHAQISLSPYNSSLLNQMKGKDSANASRVILLEDPEAAARQAEHMQALSSIYGSSSRPRSRPKAHSREGSRGRTQRSGRENE